MSRPNIVFILADDLGYADLSCYGRKSFQTPVLDDLASRGVRLTQGYANSAVCSATRVALLTGQYQHRYNAGLHEPIVERSVAGNAPVQPKFIPLPTDLPTLPRQLKQRGYSTHLVGKWHLGKLPDNGPKAYGYDTFFGFLGGAADYFQHRMYLDKQEPQDGLVVNDEFVEREGYLTDILGDESVRVIEQNAGKADPFFLSLHFNAPHWPWEGPEDEAVSKDLKDLLSSDGNIRVYGKMVKAMDDAIGRVVETLKKTGQLDNTLIIFTSDNGGERFSDTWPFIGVKSELFEGGLRVPFILSWPAGLPQGAVSEQVATTMDFLPTLLGAADANDDVHAYDGDGENLIGVLAERKVVHPRTLFWRFKGSEQAAVRDGDWKFLRIAGSEYLFNVGFDERERLNLRDREPEKFEHLKKRYDEWSAQMLPYNESTFTIIPREYFDRYTPYIP